VTKAQNGQAASLDMVPFMIVTVQSAKIRKEAVMSDGSLFLDVREIKAEEAAFFYQHGWTKLGGLISRESAQALRGEAESILKRARQASPTGTGRLADCWFSWTNSVFEARQMNPSGPFAALALSKAMAGIASALINGRRPADKNLPIRSVGGNLFCKTGGTSSVDKEVPFHQDAPSFNVGKPGWVTIWVALDELTPAQGSMRFLDGSHSVGSFGNHRSGPPLRRHPEIVQEYELSPPLHYNAGDATAHDGFTLHGSPANTTDRDRWGYACLYIARDLELDDSAYKDRGHGFPEPLEQYPLVYP
jgi:Phytanoyl-CoA dioxygenase (PhyH)